MEVNSSLEEEGSAMAKERRVSGGSYQALISRDNSDEEYMKTECYQVQLIGGSGVGKTELLHKLLSSEEGSCHDHGEGDFSFKSVRIKSHINKSVQYQYC